MNNLSRLTTFGIVPKNHQLSADEVAIIASLSEGEIDALTQNGVRSEKPVRDGVPTFHMFV